MANPITEAAAKAREVSRGRTQGRLEAKLNDPLTLGLLGTTAAGAIASPLVQTYLGNLQSQTELEKANILAKSSGQNVTTQTQADIAQKGTFEQSATLAQQLAQINAQYGYATADLQGRYGLANTNLQGQFGLQNTALQGQYGLKNTALQGIFGLQNTALQGQTQQNVANIQGTYQQNIAGIGADLSLYNNASNNSYGLAGKGIDQLGAANQGANQILNTAAAGLSNVSSTNQSRTATSQANVDRGNMMGRGFNSYGIGNIGNIQSALGLGGTPGLNTSGLNMEDPAVQYNLIQQQGGLAQQDLAGRYGLANNLLGSITAQNSFNYGLTQNSIAQGNQVKGLNAAEYMSNISQLNNQAAWNNFNLSTQIHNQQAEAAMAANPDTLANQALLNRFNTNASYTPTANQGTNGQIQSANNNFSQAANTQPAIQSIAQQLRNQGLNSYADMLSN